MQAEDSPWSAYSFEGIVDIVATKFPDADVLLLKPERMYQVAGPSFAVFSNLVAGLIDMGDPAHGYSPDGQAGERVAAVLQRCGVEEEQRRLVLVAFSKGCVALNQLLAEVPRQPAARRLLERCSAVHLVDCGVSSVQAGAYLGPDEAAETFDVLAERMTGGGLEIWLHGTPRQWDDRRRPWIGREAQAFAQALRERGAAPEVRRYFEVDRLSSHTSGTPGANLLRAMWHWVRRGTAGSLRQHFELLAEFEVGGPAAQSETRPQ